MENEFDQLKQDSLLEEVHKDERNVKTLFILIGIILIIILISIIYFYLNLSFFKNKLTESENKQLLSQISISPSLITSSTPCPDCLTVTPSIYLPTPTVQNSSVAKEYFIALGTGSNQTSDWADVPGAQATINFGNYTNIKEIHFEASINLPTSSQIVSVRLFNKTDQHPVWYSEVISNDNSSSYLVSPAIIYDNGDKLYQVQMKTQLQSVANLTQSRVHIILK